MVGIQKYPKVNRKWQEKVVDFNSKSIYSINRRAKSLNLNENQIYFPLTINFAFFKLLVASNLIKNVDERNRNLIEYR